MRFTATVSSLVGALALAACAHTQAAIKPAVEQVPVVVNVPVATGCIADAGRPAPVKPLLKLYTPPVWNALAPGAKAEAVRAQAGVRMNYEDQDRAATSGCK